MMDAANYAKAVKQADDSTIVEVQLTTDGVEHYSYARTAREIQQQREQEQQQQQDQRDEGEIVQQDTEREFIDKTGRGPSIPIVWSRDSNKFAVVRRDQRNVADLWVINALATPRPTLESYRYAHARREERAAVGAASLRPRDQGTPRRQRRSLQGPDAVNCHAASANQRAARPAAAGPGGVVERFTATSCISRASAATSIASTSSSPTPRPARLAPLSRSGSTPMSSRSRCGSRPTGAELVFWSERDGWGHFYLYDAETGALKNRITEGEFVTTGIDGIDDKARVLYISAGGREKGEDPYYTHLYRVGFDGSGMKLLTPGDATTAVSVTDSAKFFVANASRVDGPPKSALFDTLGNRVLDLETPDLTALVDAGFKYPEPFTVKADDGITDLVRRDVQAVRLRSEPEISHHRLRLSRVRRPRA